MLLHLSSDFVKVCTANVQTVYIVTVGSVIIGTVKAMLRGVNEFLLLRKLFLVRLGRYSAHNEVYDS